MRCANGVIFLIAATLPLAAQERQPSVREVDKQLFDVLKDIHNRGADLYNAGQSADCYRLFQGSLQTARAALAHRPGEQKFIDDELARVDKLTTVGARAFALHESIEQLRTRLRTAAKVEARPELLKVAPREFRVEKKIEPKKLVAPRDGVMGVIFWNGQPLRAAEVMFVSRGALEIRIAEGTTDAEGRYILEKVRPGKYTVVLTKKSDKKGALPERYATATDSPLIVDVKGGGDQLDFLLQ
jgi:hypothetical protein